VDGFGVWFAAVHEHDEKQDQIPGHPNELLTLLAFTLDEVIVRRYVIRIIEDFLRRPERNPMDPVIPFGFLGVPSESCCHITLLYIQEH
jgi:hypothetical protein